MRTTQLSAALALASILVWTPPVAAQDGDRLILRAPEAEVAGIAARHGLEILDRVDTPPDAAGHSVYLLRAPAAASPAVIAGDIEALEPAAAGVEPLALASLPETGPDVDLGQRSMAILEALERAHRFSPPTGTFDADWRGTPEDRQILAGETASLTLAMEHAVGARQDDYALAVDFAEGCRLELTREGLELGSDLRFQKNRVIWPVTNSSGQTLMIDRISVGWPAANDDLEKVRLGKDLIFDHSRDPALTVIDADWKDADHPEYRQLDPGETEDLSFEFRQEAATQPASYSLALGFAVAADGRRCHLSARNRLDLEGDRVGWAITNHDHRAATIGRIVAAWPETDGSVVAIELGGKEIVDSVFSELGTKPDGSPRHVWSAFVDQPATAVLRLAEVRAKVLGAGTVAIIDSGVDPGHPLFAHRLLPGYDFLRDEAGSASEWDDLLDQRSMAILEQRSMAILEDHGVLPLNASIMALLSAAQRQELDPAALPPAFGHGTLAAGIVHLVAPDAAILPLKAFDGHGRGNVFDIVEAIYYAVDQGAHVINMSFSTETFSPELMRAVNYAARRGVTCVAAAGNEGDEVMVYPAALGNSIGVASTTDDDTLSAFSNHGSDLVTIAAPGENLVSSYPGGGWAVASGTSFAAPWISGAVALFADMNGKFGEPGRADFYLASEALSHAASVLGELGGRAGHGRADLKEAIDNVDGGVSPDATPPAVYTITVDFAEGCTAHYPPAVTGSGCSLGVANQLSFRNNRVEWDITNAGSGPVTIVSLTLVWPEANGELRKLKLGGNEFFRGQRPPTSTTVENWQRNSSKRQIAAGETRTLLLEFENTAGES